MSACFSCHDSHDVYHWRYAGGTNKDKTVDLCCLCYQSWLAAGHELALVLGQEVDDSKAWQRTKNSKKAISAPPSANTILQITSAKINPKNRGDNGVLTASRDNIGFTDDIRIWAELATLHGIRLPRRDAPLTASNMRKWLYRLGFTTEWFTQWTGFKRVDDWRKANADWPLRSFVGLLLEEREVAALERAA